MLRAAAKFQVGQFAELARAVPPALLVGMLVVVEEVRTPRGAPGVVRYKVREIDGTRGGWVYEEDLS